MYNKELWCRVSEFDTPKHIKVTSLKRLCGADTSAKDEFRDEDGCVYRMVFEDVDRGMKERQFEIKWKSFIQDVEAQRVKKGETYEVQRIHEANRWHWVFKVQGSEGKTASEELV